MQSPWGLANITWDPTFGTLFGNITVPANAVYGPHSLELRTEGVAEPSFGASLAITVADPREPTGVLEVATNASVFKPRLNSLPIYIQASAYLGDRVRGASVELEWTLTSQGVDGLDKTGRHTLVLPSGQVTYDLALPEHDPHVFEATGTTASTLLVKRPLHQH